MAITRTEFEDVVRTMEQLAQRDAEMLGGYAAIISTEVHGRIIKAGCLIDGSPYLEIYRYGRLLEALNQARAIVKDDPSCDLLNTFEECLELTE